MTPWFFWKTKKKQKVNNYKEVDMSLQLDLVNGEKKSPKQILCLQQWHLWTILGWAENILKFSYPILLNLKTNYLQLKLWRHSYLFSMIDVYS